MAKRGRALLDIVNLKLRLTEFLRARLERAARKNNRSLNSEILARLNESFDRPELVQELAAEVNKDQEEFLQRFDDALRRIEAQFGPGSVMSMPKKGDKK